MVFYASRYLVCVRNVGLSEKLLKWYFGLYQILRCLSDVIYEVQDFDPSSRTCKQNWYLSPAKTKLYVS